MKSQANAAFAATILVCAPGLAIADTVTSLDPGSAFTRQLIAAGGTAEIVDLTGAGGALENDAPAPTGAVRLTTENTSASRAEIGRGGNYGMVSDILGSDFSVSYSWYKDDTTNNSAAPSLKLAFTDPDFVGDGYGQLVFEPYWQGAGGSLTSIPDETWVTETITLDSGFFWDTDIYGNDLTLAGGPPYGTLADYITEYGADFQTAFLTNISFGVGTYNPDVSAYVDNVVISGTAFDGSFDFETNVVPVPAALPLMLSAFGLLGFLSRRRARV